MIRIERRGRSSACCTVNVRMSQVHEHQSAVTVILFTFTYHRIAQFVANTRISYINAVCINLMQYLAIHPSNGATAQIGPWSPLVRFRNNKVLWCEVVSPTTNPR
jgi:hypothetical protein